MSTTVRAAALLLCAMLCAMLSACATSEPSRFYTLTPQPPGQSGPAAGVVTGQAPLNVALSPVQVPRYLDRPQLVTRSDANTLELAEFDKWSEPLSDMIGRALAEDLSRRLADARIFLLPVRQAVPIERIVDIQVMRFDADAAGLVTLHARWQAFSEGGRKLVAAEETLVREPAAQAGKAAVVAAMSRALSRLATDVAKALSRDRQPANGPHRLQSAPRSS